MATGCIVITSGQGREAHETAKKMRPDLIFPDIALPDLMSKLYLEVQILEMMNTPEQ